MLSVSDVILQDLIQNIFPDSLTGKIYWKTTDNHNTMGACPTTLGCERSLTGKDYVLHECIYMNFKNRQKQFMVVEVIM